MSRLTRPLPTRAVALPLVTLLVGAALLMPGTASAQADVEYLQSEQSRQMGFPFSDAVRVGHMLYLSGQVGNVPGDPAVVPGGIQAEARQTLMNIQAVLEAHGSSLSQVVKCTVMLADIAEWPALNQVYVEFFSEPYPARSAFAGSGLALNARVEIECWATVD